MKFKIMGYEINTLTMILIALAILVIVYLYLETGKKEGFESSANAVVGLLGTNFDKEITDEDVRIAVNMNGEYDERYANALKHAVCALYKTTTGLFKLADLMQDGVAANDKDIRDMKVEDVLGEGNSELRKTCKSVMKMQPLLENIINALSIAPADLGGEAFSKAVKQYKFAKVLREVKDCKDMVLANLQSSPSDETQEAVEFMPTYLNTIISCLDNLNSELEKLKKCTDSSPAVGASASSTDSIPAAVSNINTTTMATSPSQDNYNHYTGTYMPAVFYGPDGSIAKVKTNTQGSATIITTDNQGVTTTYNVKRDTSASSQGTEGAQPGKDTYYGPDGTTAVVHVDNDGNKAIKLIRDDGTYIVYSSVNVQTFTPSMDEDIADNGVAYPDSSVPTNASNYNSAYNESLPDGIPKSQIPAGQEDLYILKSEVVPPVCPACPTPIVKCKGGDSKPPPPCPPCARCPQPKFDCKKVPNYGTNNLGANYYGASGEFGKMNTPNGNSGNFLPQPGSDEYTTFGM